MNNCFQPPPWLLKANKVSKQASFKFESAQFEVALQKFILSSFPLILHLSPFFLPSPPLKPQHPPRTPPPSLRASSPLGKSLFLVRFFEMTD